MIPVLDFAKTALLGFLAVSLIFLLLRVDFLVNDLRQSINPPNESYRIHEPDGQLMPKSDPSPSDLPGTVSATLFV